MSETSTSIISTLSLPAQVERFHTLAKVLAKSCERFSASYHHGKKKSVSIETLNKQFTALQTAYVAATKSLKGRTEELTKLSEEQANVQKLFMKFFSPTSEVCDNPATGIRGLVNGGNNCAFNSTLQMIFHAKPLRESLMSVPEFGSLRKACGQYFGLLKGQVRSQKIRLMLNRHFPARISATSRFEDADEILSLMIQRIPASVVEGRFTVRREIRTYEPTGRTRAITGPVNRTRLDDQNSSVTLSRNPLLNVDLIPPLDPRDRTGRVRLPEGNFEEMLMHTIDPRDVGESGYFLGEDAGLLYEYRPTRHRIVFDDMPNQLIIRLPRPTRGNEYTATSTPMQLPRVLMLPEVALAHPVEDRRLVLKAFVLNKPGHYISYIRMDAQWYRLDDSHADPVTTAEVDQALHHYQGGGSYLHYYERGDADAEPPMSTAHRLGEQTTKAITALKALKKGALSEKTTNDELIKLFDRLPKKVKDTLFGQVYEKEGMGKKEPELGEKILRRNVRLLIKHNLIDTILPTLTLKKPAISTQLEIALQICDAITKKDRSSLELFKNLKKEYQKLAYELIWQANKKPKAADYGKKALQKDPISCLATQIEYNGKKFRIADHIVNKIMDDISGPSRPLPRVLKRSTSLKSQTEYVLELSDALKKKESSKKTLLAHFSKLSEEHQLLAYKLIKQAKKPSKPLPGYGKKELQKDPFCLCLKTTYTNQNKRIIEHLVSAVITADTEKPDSPSSPTYEPSLFSDFSSLFDLSDFKGDRKASDRGGPSAPKDPPSYTGKGSNWLKALYGIST